MWHIWYGEYAESALRLLLAVTAGAIIGLNRFLRHKPAGLRTHGLVALGTAMATVLAVNLSGSDAQALSRVLQGLVTGVGFIGAGVIMHGSSSRVQGLTTAASIWVAAILGIACGVGQFVLVAIGVVLAIALLLLGRPIEQGVAHWLHRDAKPGTKTHPEQQD